MRRPCAFQSRANGCNRAGGSNCPMVKPSSRSISTRTELAASRTREPAAGFTLLEVLVAMVIIGVVLLAALRGAMALTNSARDARTTLLAVLTAENRLLELRLASSQLVAGLNREDCAQGGLAFVCEQSIQQ